LSTSGCVTELLVKMREGDPGAENQLIQLIYDELHRLAVQHMRNERQGHSLQPTALVHEAYLQLLGRAGRNFENRNHFLAVASHQMRCILIDHARSNLAGKRGGQCQRVDLEHILLYTPERSDDLLAVDEALNRLAKWDPRQSRIVELRFFGGLTEEEVAEVLDIGVRTVKRDWRMAKAWLYTELTKRNGRDSGAMESN
jgi:RNA polymerase sigma factor (TIGR02999 family)